MKTYNGGYRGVDSTANLKATEGQSVITPTPEYSTSLVKYDAMCLAIEAACAVDEVKDIRDKAVAIQMYAKQAKNLDAERHAAEIRVRAERKCGELLADMPKAKGGNPNLPTGNKMEPVETLADLGITKRQSSEWQQLAAVPAETFEEVVAESGIPSARIILASQLIQQSLSNEHYTPSKYIEAARSVMGAIDLDPASCEQANLTVKAARFFTEDEDGLNQEWNGRVWLNPPYGRQVGDFIAKLEGSTIDQAIVLVNAHCTDTIWFQPLWNGTLCFTNHRVNFHGDDLRSGSTHGSVFVYFGDNRSSFIEAFSEFGVVVERAK